MPRGIYDRSKRKSSTTSTVAKKAAGKPGPKKGFKRALASSTTPTTPITNPDGFSTFQSYLHSLAGVISSGIKSQAVQDAVENTVLRLERIAEGLVPLAVQAIGDAVEGAVTTAMATTIIKKRPGPKPGFKKTAKITKVKEATDAVVASPANGSMTPAPFNAPPAPPRA